MEKKELGNEPDSVLLINEPDFLLNIYKWNDTTKEFLKAFAERKYNNNKNKKSEIEQPHIQKKEEIEIGGVAIIDGIDFSLILKEWNEMTKKIYKILIITNGNANKNKKSEIEQSHIQKKEEITETNTESIPSTEDTQVEEKTHESNKPEEKKLQICQYKVKEDEILATDNSVNIYKQIEEYLEENLPDIFSRRDMINLMIKAWKKIFNEELSEGSASTYYSKYKRYMEKHNLIRKGKDLLFHKVGEEDDDDGDDGKDHCYLPDWTKDEMQYLEYNIFMSINIDEAIKKIAKKLGKSEDEVRLKAKKRGMILR